MEVGLERIVEASNWGLRFLWVVACYRALDSMYEEGEIDDKYLALFKGVIDPYLEKLAKDMKEE